VVIRGHQRQSHLEGGGVDDRHQLATACIERRAGAHRTARERVDEFGLLILRVGRARAIRGHQRQLTNSDSSYCESGRARAIRGHQRQLTNSDCSYCESGRARAIRGHQRQSRVGLVLSEVVMGDQSQSGSVRGNQRTLICNHVATRGNQRQSDVHSDAIERESYEIRCNQEAIRGHQRPSVQLTCQSGSASSPPSSSSPASTCGKRRGRQGEQLHAEARPSRGSAAPRAPRLPRGVACARRAGRGARWWSQTPLEGGARASKRANRYLPSRVIKGHQGSSRVIQGDHGSSVAIKGHQWP
jgi:hypothetical protein